MAVALGPLVAEVKENIELSELGGKRLAIDAYNTIYQFLSIIRQPDGTPLLDSKGMVTSHLSGLFYRTINLIEQGITPIFVFDGIPPALKKKTIEARMERREKAYEEWQEAKEKGLAEEARMHAMASSRINKQIVESAKELLKDMGIAYIQAPAEGEAQAAYMVKNGMAYAVASQDYDTLLFDSRYVIRNIAITGRRKLPKKNVYVEVAPEFIELEKLLRHFSINLDKLIWLGVLVGTDFNDGVKGIGPKTALRIVREHESIESVVKYVDSKYGTNLAEGVEDVVRIFKEPEVAEMSVEELNRRIREGQPDKEAILRFMCDLHGFSAERISKFADKLVTIRMNERQKGISDWLD
ncbi:MAG: flap endonuclease-1 [Candidatus Micrarchaeaceae archaeon]